MSNSLAFSGFFLSYSLVFYLHASRESRVRVRSRVIVSSLVVVDVTETLCCSCWSKWEKHHRHQGTEIPPKNVGRNDIDVVCVPLAQENKNTFVRVRIIILLLANNQMCTCGYTHPRTHLVAHAHTSLHSSSHFPLNISGGLFFFSPLHTHLSVSPPLLSLPSPNLMHTDSTVWIIRCHVYLCEYVYLHKWKIDKEKEAPTCCRWMKRQANPQHFYLKDQTATPCCLQPLGCHSKKSLEGSGGSGTRYRVQRCMFCRISSCIVILKTHREENSRWFSGEWRWTGAN